MKKAFAQAVVQAPKTTVVTVNGEAENKVSIPSKLMPQMPPDTEWYSP